MEISVERCDEIDVEIAAKLEFLSASARGAIY
jgi:hypothetical protein